MKSNVGLNTRDGMIGGYTEGGRDGRRGTVTYEPDSKSEMEVESELEPEMGCMECIPTNEWMGGWMGGSCDIAGSGLHGESVCTYLLSTYYDLISSQLNSP